jgi:hypothetical protein
LGTEDQVPENTAGDTERLTEEDAASLLNGLEIAFLKDVVDYPDSGVAARYKRLGLSGRQGQKLKTSLLDQGLIEEQLGTTQAGRLMTIRLTEQGRQLLLKAGESV